MTSVPAADHAPTTREDPRPWVAFDWSLKALHVTFDGKKVTKMGDVTALLDVLDRPHRIVAEATFESWEAKRRAALVAQIRAAGHEIYVFRPSNTARVRRALGYTKSDANDARVIYRIAAEGLRHLYPLPTPDPDWQQFRAEANHEYVRLRLAREKPELIRRAKLLLPSYDGLDDEAQKALGNPKTGYSPTLLAAAYFAAQRCDTRASFERLLGLHGSAYPSLLRAEVLTHSYRWVSKRGVTWTAYRRHLRWMYRTLRTQLAAAMPANDSPSQQ